MSYSPKALQVGSRVGQIRINHTAFKEALEGVGRVIQLGNNLQHPVDACVIVPPGAGKSCLIKSVQCNVCNWPFLRPESVLIAFLKEASTVAQIQKEFLVSFKYATPPRAGKETNVTLSNVLVATIEQHDIQLIVIDEYQYVFLSRRGEVRVSINDRTKRLMTTTLRPVMSSGTDQLHNIEKADLQLTMQTLPIFYSPSLKDKEWLGALNGLAKETIDVDLSELNTHAKPVFNATEGVMRILKGLIMKATMIVVDANVTEVKKEHLRLAFRRLVGTGSSKCNPFAWCYAQKLCRSYGRTRSR